MRCFLTPLTVTASGSIGDDITKTYDRNPYAGSAVYNPAEAETSPNLFGTLSYGASEGAVNAGTYDLTLGGLYSNQQGYDITLGSGTLTILPKALTGNITAANKFYDATTEARITSRTLTGVIAGDVVSYRGGTATFADPDVGVDKTVTATGLSLTGASAGNYIVNSTAYTTANITLFDPTPYIYGLEIGGAIGVVSGVAGYYLIPVVTNLFPAPPPIIIERPPNGPPLPPPLILSYLAPPPVVDTSGGITVQVLRGWQMPTGNTPGREGLIIVSIAEELTQPGSLFSFALPERIANEIAAHNYPVTITLADGSPLPVWLQYNPDSKTFTAANVPAGSLPITIMINFGGQSWKLEIKKQQ